MPAGMQHDDLLNAEALPRDRQRAQDAVGCRAIGVLDDLDVLRPAAEYFGRRYPEGHRDENRGTQETPPAAASSRVTSISRPFESSWTNPRTWSFFGTNGDSSMRRSDS